MDTTAIISIAVSATVFCVAFIIRCFLKPKTAAADCPKKTKRTYKLLFWAELISVWYFAATVINGISGRKLGINVDIEMLSPRVDIFGLSVSQSTVLTWIIIAVVLILALVFRFAIYPKFTDHPKGIQNVMELAVEAMDKFTGGTVNDFADDISPYMFSVAVLMVCCAAMELFGQRAPTADITMTATLGLFTFVLINYYGIKKKTLKGRIKALASPSPMIMPMKILSDVAVPVSLACRLFGNMLGGLIVMDLLRSSLAGYSVGITSLAGIYFNLFHPLIQTYIFITLSLTFINEAME